MNYTFGWKLKEEGWKEAKQEYYSQMHLDKKHYTFETFTKDMLYMTELQEVLK